MRKGCVAIVLLAAVLATVWLRYSKHVQARREAAYQTAIAPYKRDLTVGMDRGQVIAYFKAHDTMCLTTTRYGGSDGDTCEIKIAEEPVGLIEQFFCEPRTVYVAFDFSSADRLSDIHIRKIGTCV